MKGAYSILEAMFGRKPEPVEEQYNNRYSLTVKTKDKTRKTYCFSTPIRRINTGELVSFQFKKEDNCFTYSGSNSNFIIKDNGIDIYNNDGFIQLEFNIAELHDKNGILTGEGIKIYPNLNGIRILHSAMDGKVHIRYKYGFIEYELRNCSKALSFMREPFRPFMTVTPIGCIDSEGIIKDPAFISAKETGPKTGTFDLISFKGNSSDSIEYEICLCERKLFLDTTVSSRFPEEKNAFGGISFLGNSEAFGCEMLYSRIDPGVLKDIKTERMKKAVLHIPKLSTGSMKMRVGTVKERFCSFGSTWNNRVEEGNKKVQLKDLKRYYSIDLSDHLFYSPFNHLLPAAGIIIGGIGKGSKQSIISTGDCCSYPQILEITE